MMDSAHTIKGLKKCSPILMEEVLNTKLGLQVSPSIHRDAFKDGAHVCDAYEPDLQELSTTVFIVNHTAVARVSNEEGAVRSDDNHSWVRELRQATRVVGRCSESLKAVRRLP